MLWPHISAARELLPAGRPNDPSMYPSATAYLTANTRSTNRTKSSSCRGFNSSQTALANPVTVGCGSKSRRAGWTGRGGIAD